MNLSNCLVCHALVAPGKMALHYQWHRQQMTVPALEWGTGYDYEVRPEPTEEAAREVATRGHHGLYCRIPGDAWTEVVQ